MIFVKKKGYATKLMLLAFILGVSLLFTLCSKESSNSAKAALRLCASSVVPSLFPFMVLSSMAAAAASRLTGAASPRAAVVLPVVLGALCGFPVGAACTASMYRCGALDKGKAERLAALCNNTSPAFAVDVIGRSFWGNTGMGWMFYICQILSASAVYLIWSGVSGKIHGSGYSANDKNPSFSTNAETGGGIAEKFCCAVKESSVTVVQICGYIVFFRVICDAARKILSGVCGSGILYTSVAAFLEFTSGSAAAAELGGISGIMLCGFSVGFSGLSVMAQSAGLMSSAGLRCSTLFAMRLAVGALSAVMCGGIYCAVDFPEPVFEAATKAVPYSVSPAASAAILLLSAAAFLYVRLHRNCN